MKWEEYEVSFTQAAVRRDLNQDYIDVCLSYAKKLNQNAFPIIFDTNHLTLLLGYAPEYVIAAAYGGRSFYREFKVKKRSGGERVISEPLPSLKEIQRWILDNILYVPQPSRYAKGFVPNLSIKDNARFHRAQPNICIPSVNGREISGINV